MNKAFDVETARTGTVVGSGDRLYTLEEAAARIHTSVKPAALRAAVNEGRLVARKVGRTLLIGEADLRAYLEECRTCPVPAKDPASACSAPMSGTMQSPARASVITAGTSSGRKPASGASERRALTIAQQLKNGKPPLPPSSPSRTEAGARPGHVIPIK